MSVRILFGELYIDQVSNFAADCAAFISSKYVVSLETVAFAAEKAIKNWNAGERIARSLPIEILLYYAATRQIRDALKLGVSSGLNRVAAVVLNQEEFCKLSFRELNFAPEYDLNAVKNHYELADAEIEIAGYEKIPLLVRERIALFSAFKERV